MRNINDKNKFQMVEANSTLAPENNVFILFFLSIVKTK